MKKSNINYPYPVLNSFNDDYLDCHFNIVVSKLEIIGEMVNISIDYELNCESIKKLIDSDKAKVVIYIQSVLSEYRKIFIFEKDLNNMDIAINKNLLGKKVDIQGYIIATKDLSPFNLKEHNKILFGSVPFKVNYGDKIAISNDTLSFNIDYYDPLSDKPSIFAILRSDDNELDVNIEYIEHEKIYIRLNDETYDEYLKLHAAPELRSIISTLFAVPALIEVLSFMKNISDDDLDVRDRKWYQVIEYRMKELKLSFENESLNSLASKILPKIFPDYLRTIGKVFDEISIESEAGK